MARKSWLCGIVLVAFASQARTDEKADAKNAGFEKLKKLAGTWVMADDKGNPTDKVVSVFKVIAAGSAVQESIFPGSDHEMVTMYHLDGKEVLLTHYCAAGNQPKLKLDAKAPANTLKFDFVGGTNFDPAKDMHMHNGSITIVDDDHIEWSWQGYVKGKPAEGHGVSMKLVRKK